MSIGRSMWRCSTSAPMPAARRTRRFPRLRPRTGGGRRRRAGGETVEQIQPDLIIPTGRRKGQSPSLSSIYRALAEHEKRKAYPDAVTAAHADFAALQQHDRSPK
ncbi:hypothetical protein [Streptomyces sp. NPDC058424]|uniref:hypothetical protein n=1 Tax=Streptomyces sp. NPDC058424 TaxID=3346491 RepID=UPI00365264B1